VAYLNQWVSVPAKPPHQDWKEQINLGHCGAIGDSVVIDALGLGVWHWLTHPRLPKIPGLRFQRMPTNSQHSFSKHLTLAF